LVPDERKTAQRRRAGRLPEGGRPDARAHRPAGPATEELARARQAFLGDEQVRPGVVRKPILASWTRSRGFHVPADHLEMPYESDREGDTPLTRAAGPVLRDAADLFGTEPVSVILCDDDCVVLERRTGDSTLDRHLDRVWLAPGFSYAERYIGTNGIGTALEGRGPAQVFGHEHYAEHLEDLACAGVPIRHPINGTLVGVLDLTCWRRDASMMMAHSASVIGARIEEALLERSGRREHELLHDYIAACRRSRGIVFALSNDLLMMNDKARELLDPSDQTPVLVDGAEALASGRRQKFVMELPSGLVVRVDCVPTSAPGGVGGVLNVQLLGQPPAEVRTVRAGRPALPTAVGSGAPWVTCCHTVDRHFRAREWLVLEGEPGTGKETLARATHQNRSPAGHLRVVDADEYGPQWMAEVVDELETGGGSLVLTHLDRLPPAALQVLPGVLEPHRESTHPDRPWVVATVSHEGAERAEELGSVLACFPRTIQVPPLRHHIDDVAELVPHLLARLTGGAALSCSAGVMRVLMRNRWPGNVEQLRQVLRSVVAKRRSGVVELRDLPPECLAMTRRVLTQMEAIECDAIVSALLAARGSKTEAARRLGMSRATIYRKIHDYGISMVSPRESEETP
jgi:sigma-54 dependent transcriptional regulator, acetoin dehydrogenase operon transcriptional activator AcoR